MRNWRVVVQVPAEMKYSGTPDSDELKFEQNESTPSDDTNVTDDEEGGALDAGEREDS